MSEEYLYSKDEEKILEVLAEKCRNENWTCVEYYWVYQKIMCILRTYYRALMYPIAARNIGINKNIDEPITKFVDSGMFDRNVLKLICEFSGKDGGNTL